MDNSSNYIKQKTFSVRGSLHKDTFFGKLKKPSHQGFEKQDVYVSRVELNGDNFKDEKALEKIVDKNIVEILSRRLRLAKYNGQGERAFSAEALIIDPVYMYSVKDELFISPKSKNGNQLPVIKKVRVANKNSRNLIQIPAKESEKNKNGINRIIYSNRYAEADGNYVMALYEQMQYDKKGNEKKPIRDFEIVSFYDAVNKRRKGEKLFPDEKNGVGLMKKCPYLIAGDLVVMYEENEEEINWNDNGDLKKRLYKVTQLSSKIVQKKYEFGDLFFIHHSTSGAGAKYESVNFSNSVVNKHIQNSHVQLQVIKVKINQLGKIERY